MKISREMICVCVIMVLLKIGLISTITDEQYAHLPSIFESDSFDNCMLLGEDALFCRIEFQLKPSNPENISDTWKQIAELNADPRNYRHDKLRHGICIPFTCPSVRSGNSSEFLSDLERCYNSKKFENNGLHGTISRIFCQNNEPMPYDIYDKIVLCFLLTYFLLIIFATSYATLAKYGNAEYYRKIMDAPGGKLISCFSLTKNFQKLGIIRENEENEDLKCIQGVRFYLMAMVIAVHYSLSVHFGPISNTRFVETLSENSWNTFVDTGRLSIQTFFLISSWLTTYYFYVDIGSVKEINIRIIILAFIKRYIRLTLPMSVVLALHSTLIKQAPKGPFWDMIVGSEFENCRKNGWTNLLYINNYVNSKDMCMINSWYLASDTQLFLLSLFILYAMKRFPNKIKWILGISLVVGISIPGIVAFMKNYDILVRIYPEYMHECWKNVEEFHVLYIAGYSNIGACVFGIIFGYFYSIYRKVDFKLTKVQIFSFFVFSMITTLGNLSCGYFIYNSSFHFTNVHSAIYWSLSKNLFSLGIGILIFGMTRNLGWIFPWLCRLPPAIILGRLSYSAYLVHFFLIRIQMSSVRYPVYIDNYLYIVGSIGGISLSFIFAFIFHLSFEAPVIALQRIWMPHRSEEKKRT